MRAHAAYDLARLAMERGDPAEEEHWLRQSAVTITESEYDPSFPRLLCSVLIRLGELAEADGEVAYAEQLYRSAAEITEQPDAYRALGELLAQRDELAEAELWLRKGAEAGHGDSMLVLGHVLARRGDQAAASQWIWAAFAAMGMADLLSGGASDPPGKAEAAVRLLHMYELGGRSEYLDRAVALLRAALDTTPPDDPEHAGYLDTLGCALQLLFERTGELEVLVEAVDVGRAAVAATPTDHPDRATTLSNFGPALQMLFDHTSQPEVLTEAVEIARAAVDASLADDPARPAILHTLATTLHILHQTTGQEGALSEAVEVGREALAAIPSDDRERPTFLHTLGIGLWLLHRSTGHEEVLSEAVEVARQAVHATTVDNIARHKFLGALAMALRTMYEQTGQLEVLVEAVEVSRQGLDAVPVNHRARASHLGDLGMTLLALSRRTGQAEVLGEAVKATRDALDAVPEDRSERAIYLSNLALALQGLYVRCHEGDVLVEAVNMSRQAADATPPGHPEHPMYLNNLASTLLSLFELTDDPHLLIEAIEAARASVDATAGKHPARAGRLINLGNTLRALYAHSGRRQDLAEARRAFREAAANEAGATMERVTAYRQLAMLAEIAGDAPDGLRCIEAAIDLMDLLVPGSLARSDRENRLGHVADLADEAVAAALNAGQPARAVELLERTRGILAADTLGLRGDDHARLRERYPDLADRLELLRYRIDVLDRPRLTPWPDENSSGVAQASAGDERRLSDQRREAHAAWQSLLEHIRSLPGFADFFRAAPISVLARHAHDGPVVYVIAGDSRADALILTDGPDPVDVVPLSGLTHETVRENVIRLTNAAHAADARDLYPEAQPNAQGEILEVLDWLWRSVAEPVLTRLGHTAAPAEHTRPARIRWCPVGIFVFLPLHAAGRYTRRVKRSGAPRSVLDLVVSSYTPTVRALARSQGTRPATASSALIVPVPDLPGAELPGVSTETTAIAALLPGAHTLHQPTRGSVLRTLPAHRIVHFACHGYADNDQPARSSLILTDHAETPFTLADVNALHIDADLAYLSACGTALTTLRLANESLHISGAFHLAGYRHVIGTLWPIGDDAAAEIAEHFYRHLTNDGTAPPDADRAADALHYATTRLRRRYPASPSLWAAYTHTGA